MRDERGFALVITLLITALLVALAVEFVDEVFVDTSARHNFVEAQQAGFMAESGITAGFTLLQFNQSFALARPLEIDDETGHLSVTMEDESSRLNFNQIFGPNGKILYPINNDIATRLLKKLGLSPTCSTPWLTGSMETMTPIRRGPNHRTMPP